MNHYKKVNVSPAVHQCIEQEAKRLKLSHRQYLEAAAMFFLDRRIDPRTYQPETAKQVVQQVVDRIFSYLVHQEKHLLKDLLTEVTKARILSELSVNHLLTLVAEDEVTFQQLQQQDQQYLTERLQQAISQSDKAKFTS
jgi:hypothetical protein